MSFTEGGLDTHNQHDTGIIENFFVVYVGHQDERYVESQLLAIRSLL